MAAAQMTGALLDADWKKSFSILGDAAGQMGPAAKAITGAAGLFAVGSLLNFAGGAMSLGGKGAAGAGLLSRMAPMLLNPYTAGAVAIGGTFGAIGWAGADNDKHLKQAKPTRS